MAYSRGEGTSVIDYGCGPVVINPRTVDAKQKAKARDHCRRVKRQKAIARRAGKTG